MRLIQINLNHCEAAQDLLTQRISEEKIDVAIISEPYKNVQSGTWAIDETGTAAIWACGSFPFQQANTQSAGFVRAKIRGIYFYSCYAPPRWTLEEFQRMLHQLTADAQSNPPVVIAGDFNAWAIEWGSRQSNARGRCLLEAFASLPITLLNHGNGSTFRGAGGSSVIDISFVSESLVARTTWSLSEDFTYSDHQAITMNITQQCERRKEPPNFTGPKWKDSCFDEETFTLMLSSSQMSQDSAEEMAQDLHKAISTACDAAMPRRAPTRGRKPCYWWTEDIRKLRAACFKARRRAQRAQGRPTWCEEQAKFEQLRGDLRNAIKKSKISCFQRISQDADINPFGTAYRVVCKRIRAQKSPELTCATLLRTIVGTLFPHGQPFTSVSSDLRRDITIPAVTTGELLEACAKIGDRKTPGPDGIPNKALKVAIRHNPEVFRTTFQKCLDDRVFPRRWKVQKLVLIPKPNKPPGEPSSYRPICLLDTMGKMLERLICNRLQACVEEKGAISDLQYGFRKGRSTIDAIKKLVDIASDAIEGKRWQGGTKEYCAVVTLDIKNAFNSANWGLIHRALFRMGAPGYLCDLIHNYFTERKLIYASDEGIQLYDITAGVPQGSVLGPLLWNIMYDGVLRLPLPERTTIIGFADDIAIVVVEKSIREIQATANTAIKLVNSWLEEAGLELAAHKTEAVLISSRKIPETFRITVGETAIQSSRTLKYLGVIIDDRLNFKEHVKYAGERAATTQVALSRIMPNIGGPRPLKRRIIQTVSTSIMLYASPIWSRALAEEKTRRNLSTVHRLGAIRVVCGFRTISDEAALVLAGTLPIDILADEMRRTYFRRLENPDQSAIIKTEERQASMGQWQRRWERSTKGRWTFQLLPRIIPWVNRQHGELNFYMTQFMTNHGCFRKYLTRFGHDSSPSCPTCAGVDEDAVHAILICPRFRRPFETEIDPQQLVGEMIESVTKWDETNTFVTEILLELRRLERARTRVGLE